MKAAFSKRLLAYVIDLIIVTFVATIITGLIPTSEKINSLQQTLYEVQNNITEKEVNISETYSQINNIGYEINREMVLQNITIIVIYLLYFVVLPMYNNGQTFGKKVTKIKIVSRSNSTLSMNNMLVRCLVLHGIARDIILIILILSIKKDMYISTNIILNIVQEVISITILFMVIINKKGIGLHDILGKTMVIEEE